MKVKLTYFRETGKYYSDGEFEIGDQSIHEVWATVAQLLSAHSLPGLIGQHSPFIVLVTVPGHPHDHPRLVFPGDTR